MALRLFNTLTRTVEDFTPRDPAAPSIGMYCCGPTVHDFAHIGNFRTFVFADLVRRYLEFRGFSVRHVMNITDVEDKIIARVRAAGSTLRDFTRTYETAFLEDLDTLACLRPHHLPRATEHLPEIIDLIARLLDRGLAYLAPDRSIYFSIDKYRACGCTYGQLVRLNLDELRRGERVSSDEYAKESVADFALWKARAPEDGDVFWPSPWGEGRPGWHIECSAMSMKLLGPSFDLHLGGEDLIFPHHEDEIAQSEGAALQPHGDRFVRFWLHGAHLLVEGRKMSKSLNNYFTLRDLLARGHSGREIRYLLLTAHYRESFNFTLENLAGARSALTRIDDCLGRLGELAAAATAEPDPSLLARFTAALDDDLNVSAAWAVIFDWVRDINRQLADASLTPDQAAAALAAWTRINQVLAIGSARNRVVNVVGTTGSGPLQDVLLIVGENVDVPSDICELVAERQAARQARNFRRADELRDLLKARGWTVEDGPKGARIRRLPG